MAGVEIHITKNVGAFWCILLRDSINVCKVFFYLNTFENGLENRNRQVSINNNIHMECMFAICLSMMRDVVLETETVSVIGTRNSSCPVKKRVPTSQDKHYNEAESHKQNIKLNATQNKTKDSNKQSVGSKVMITNLQHRVESVYARSCIQRRDLQHVRLDRLEETNSNAQSSNNYCIQKSNVETKIEALWKQKRGD